METLGVVLAVAAALGNAIGSVWQRMASRHHDSSLRAWQGVVALLRRPVWTAGIAAHVVGFVLQGVALGMAPITVVQPLLIAELPFTLILSALLLSTPMGRRAWWAVAAVAGGVAAFLYCLDPHGGNPQATPTSSWVIGSAVVVAVIAALVVVARRSRGQRRALLFGAATGLTYGYNAALLTGVAAAYAGGLPAVLTAWQTYGVLVGGTLSFVFLQQALQAGDLVAAQPAITLANPLLALAWGFVIFSESIEVSLWTLGAVAGAVAVVVGTIVLTREAAPAVAPVADEDITPGPRPREGRERR